MEIRILQLLEGAKKAEGLTVVIDVFRAFSLECYIMGRNAAAIVPVGDLAEVYRLKAEHPDYMLFGERKGKKCEGFDYGNSPYDIRNADLAGKTVIHTTSAGTQGIANAANAEEILTGSFVNAAAIAAYIQKQQPQIVSLVCMGYEAEQEALEDTLCAEYIKSLILGAPLDTSGFAEQLKTAGERFFRLENQEAYPEQDFWLCLQYNKFPFVLKVVRADGLCTVVREDCSI